jgi:hypothetical protein
MPHSFLTTNQNPMQIIEGRDRPFRPCPKHPLNDLSQSTAELVKDGRNRVLDAVLRVVKHLLVKQPGFCMSHKTTLKT